jgi:outer membrane protein
MKLRLNSIAGMLVAAAVVAAPAAMAQSAGQWTVKGGVTKITPKVESGDVSAPALPGSKADIGADTQPTFGFTYSFTDNISTEVALGLPYKHKIYGAGSIEGTGELGSVRSLPPTVFAQYRFFKPDAVVRPYVGLGATYAYFTHETGSGRLTAVSDIGSPTPTTFKVKSKLAATLQLGMVYNINARYYADLFVTKTFLKTNVNFSSGQHQDLTLNPEAVGIAIGYKF